MKNTSLIRRIGAMIYDGLLVLALLLITTFAFTILNPNDVVEPGTISHQISLASITFIFFVGFWSHYGRTLGMQSWGLRIETLDGGEPDLRQCTIRYFAALLSWLPIGLGFLWSLFDRENLAWHDRLSGTRLRHYPRKK